MNYIFFDIECANCEGGQAKICSFGYVVTNEAFEVLEKEDLLVNPRAPFMLTGHRNRPYIKLAYDKEEFKKAPDFPGVYEKIRELLNRRDSLIFGYAADNDAALRVALRELLLLRSAKTSAFFPTKHAEFSGCAEFSEFFRLFLFSDPHKRNGRHPDFPFRRLGDVLKGGASGRTQKR